MTAVAGSALARSEEDGAPTQLVAGARLRESTRLETADHARLHARLGDHTGIVLASATAASLERLRDGEVRIALEHGAVTSQVRHLDLEQGEAYDVRADPYVVHVRGTRFAVVREGRAVAVTVDEGVVEIGRDGRTIAVVRAPGVWRSEDGLDGAVALPLGTLELPRGLDPAAARWPTARLPHQPRLREWRVDDVTFDAAGDVEMRAPIGDLPILAIDVRGRQLRATLHVTEDGATLAAADLLPLVRTGYLAPELIVPVVQAGTPAVQGCYNLLLRRRPDFDRARRVTMRVTVGLTGEVERLAVRSAEGEASEIPSELVSCITSHARQWDFPPPTGGPVTFDVPFSFTSRGAR